MSGDGREHDLEVGLAERGPALERRQLAVAPEHGRLPELQVDVAGAELDGAFEQGVEIHGGTACIGTAARGL